MQRYLTTNSFESVLLYFCMTSYLKKEPSSQYPVYLFGFRYSSHQKLQLPLIFLVLFDYCLVRLRELIQWLTTTLKDTLRLLIDLRAQTLLIWSLLQTGNSADFHSIPSV